MAPAPNPPCAPPCMTGGCASFHAREGLEQAVALARRDAGTVVVHADHGARAVAFDGERHARARVAHGVAQHIGERAREVLRVAREGGRDFARRLDRARAARGAHFLVGAAQDLVHQLARRHLARRVGRRLAQARQHQQLAHQLVEIRDVALHRPEALLALGLARAGARELEVELELRKRRAQLVRHALLEVAVRLQERLDAARHHVERGGDGLEEGIARHARAHPEVALAHPRGRRREALEVAPQRARPAPQDRAHRRGHEGQDDRVIDHLVLVEADPLDA